MASSSSHKLIANICDRRTMDYLDTVIGDPHNRLVDWVTIHPRTRSTPSTTPIRREALEILTEKYAGTLPILLSGDIFDLASLPIRATKPTLDVDLATLTIKNDPFHPRETNSCCPHHATPLPKAKPSNTQLSGFMSARGLLANPALYAGYATCPWEALETLMCRIAQAPLPFKLAHHHIQEIVGTGYGDDKSSLLSKKERAKMNELTNMVDLIDFLDEKVEEHTGQVGGIRRDL